MDNEADKEITIKINFKNILKTQLNEEQGYIVNSEIDEILDEILSFILLPKTLTIDVSCLNQLFVGNLPSNTRLSELINLFSAYGSIDRKRCVMKKNYAFIQYKNEEDVDKAVQNLDEALFKDRFLKVQHSFVSICTRAILEMNCQHNLVKNCQRIYKCLLVISFRFLLIFLFIFALFWIISKVFNFFGSLIF